MKRSPQKIATLREMAGDGMSATDISRALGVTLPCILNWAKDECIPLISKAQAMKAAMADPEVRARKSAAMKAAMADPEVRARHAAAMADPEVRARIKASRAGAKGILIPKWVPLDLHDEFLDVAAYDGEEKAASHIRKLKREMVTA